MRKPIILILGLWIVLGACQQFDELGELDRVDYQAEYALPLVDTKTSIRQLLEGVEENTSVLVDENNQIHLRYRGDVISETSDDIFAAVDEALPPVIPVTGPRMALPFSSPEGLRIDQLKLKTGSLIYFFESKLEEAADVEISFPQVQRNGEPLTFRHRVPAYSGEGDPRRVTNVLAPASLAGYSITADNDSIYIQYEAVQSNGQAGTLNNFLLRIQDLTFSYAEGYLGSQVYEGERDTIEIDFFDNWVRGDVYFEDPRITFEIQNSFGIPTRSIVNVFDVITVNGEVLSLEGPAIFEGIDFPYPGIDEVGELKESSFAFTADNSNIAEILGAGPVAVDYEVDALTNPDNNTSIRGFITDSSFYRVRVQVDLPLYGRASDFVSLDTFELDFTAYENIDYADFRLVTDNQLPLDVDIQAYFLDENGIVLDSLLDDRQRIVSGSPVTEDGLATEETQWVMEVPFPADRFEGVRDARRLALSASFSTIEDGTRSVRILADQEIRIRIGAILGVSGGE